MGLNNKKCVPCEGDISPLTNEEEDKYLNQLKEWQVIREGVHKIKKDFSLSNFVEAIKFVNKVADVAESEGHHPNIAIYYNLVIIELYTHSISGLSENDFILAAKIDDIF